jgi:FAD/FMN-containing dehydrogenase
VAVASWTDPAEDHPRRAAARRYAGAVEPFSSGVDVNALGDEWEEGVQRAYGPDKLARLATLKDRYDPENVLHLNHNIRPRKEQPR